MTGSRPGADVLEVRELSAWLRTVARRSCRLSSAGRQTVIRVCLAHRLSGRRLGDVLETLRRLEQVFAGGDAPRQESLPPPPTAEGDDRALLEALVSAISGAESASPGEAGRLAARAAESVAWLKDRTERLARRVGVPAESVRELFDALDRRLDGEKAAIQRAGKEAFDRLFESVDPERLREQGSGRGLKLGPFQKASLFEAWEEKFAQIRAYHKGGRLVGDLRASFQRYAAHATEEEEGS